MLNLDSLGLSAVVDEFGIKAPDYQTILTTLIDYFKQIYGADAYLEPDSKDGQLLSIFALAIHDANNSAIAVYNSFSPSTAYGNGLSTNVKINGILRRNETHSVADVMIAGEAGTAIKNGRCRDRNGVIWLLPDEVIIGINGTTIETVTCELIGSVVALPNSINEIASPTRGWFSVTNPSHATIGTPRETDTELRIRQRHSVALASLTVMDSLQGAIADIDGVTRYKVYENDTSEIDDNGMPPHSIAAVVEGGSVSDIADIIIKKKGQGVGTYGDLNVDLADSYGNPKVISFFRPVIVHIDVQIELKPFAGYTSTIGEQIKKSVSDYINQIDVGDDVLLGRLYSPAHFCNKSDSQFYEVLSIKIGRNTNSLLERSLEIDFKECAITSIDKIELVIT